MNFSDAMERLRNDDVALMFITDDMGIHHLEWDEERLCFVKGGTYGYDEETSMKMLQDVVENDGCSKFVDMDEIGKERNKLVDGHWETVTEWADDIR